MKINSEDLKQLLSVSIEKFERKAGISIDSTKFPVFFKSMSNEIEQSTGIVINPNTLYKQIYIRIKNWDKPVIGASLDILNALCKFAFDMEYVYKFNQVVDDESNIPEFPWTHPSFPATPAIPISIPGFTNVWIKDESLNPTGLHKDRMAWEVYLFLRNKIEDSVKKGERIKMPRLSIISNGNAAISIQNLLAEHGFHNLKVLFDPSLVSVDMVDLMNKMGCELYPEDLQIRHFSKEDILKLTNNINGVDLTYGEDVDKNTYYDWLSYEILNLNPTFCFIPYGSGEVLRNILEINKMELKAPKTSKRFFGNKEILSRCCFIGAKAKEPSTNYIMLYAKHNKFSNSDFIYYFDTGVCSRNSRIEFLDEETLIVDPDNPSQKITFLELASRIANKNNIAFEPSGISGLSMFLQLSEQLGIKKNDKVVILNTGKLKVDNLNYANSNIEM